jgi:hypothetical protein
MPLGAQRGNRMLYREDPVSFAIASSFLLAMTREGK